MVLRLELNGAFERALLFLCILMGCWSLVFWLLLPLIYASVLAKTAAIIVSGHPA